MHEIVSRMNRWILLVLIAVYGVAPWWMRGVQPRVYEPAFKDSRQDAAARNSSAAARLFGGFRTNASDLLFVKTEVYLHGGVAYEPHVVAPPAGQSAASASHANHDACEGGVVGTRIPPPERDWRGFIGVLERQVSPWMHPDQRHHHTEGRQLLPLLWLATRANPHNIKAYRVGTFWLKSLNTDEGRAEAVAFAREGVRNNPDNFILRKNLGVALRAAGQHAEALEEFRAAIKLALEQRPPEGLASSQWDEDREEELEASVRYAVAGLERAGQYQDALELIDFANGFLQTKATLASTRQRIADIISGKRPAPTAADNEATEDADKLNEAQLGRHTEHEHEHESGDRH